MRIIFFGTPSFAVDILSFLVEKKWEIVGIVSQPSRIKGRAKDKSFLVSDFVAQTVPNIRLYQPQKASSKDFLAEMESLRPDLFVVVAYGQILSQALLDIPTLGCINVHASLLPALRGAAPIQRSILQGEKETGISIMKMVLEMDAGDVISQAKVVISEDLTGGELEKKLALLAKPLLCEAMEQYAKGTVVSTAQNPKEVTFAPKIRSEEFCISWEKPAREIHNQIRAFSPQPGAYTYICIGKERKFFKIFQTKCLEKKGIPGEISSLSPFIVGCREGSLEILSVQVEGKKVMSAGDFIRGMREPFSFCE